MSDVNKVERKLSEMCTGEEIRKDLMMILGSDCSWAQFLTPAPFAIALLGDLLLVLAEKDFSLEHHQPIGGFKHIKYPKSFRTCMVHVCNQGWEAFNAAHTNMEQINLQCGKVERYVKQAVGVILRGTPMEVKLSLPKSLKNIQDIADENVRLAKETEDRFFAVMQLTGELLEVYSSKKGECDITAQESKAGIQFGINEKENVEQQKKEAEQRLKKMEKEVEDAQANFKRVTDNAPGTLKLFVLSAGEALIESVRSIFSFPWASKPTKTYIPEEESYQQDNNLDIELSKHAIYKEVTAIKIYLNSLIEIVLTGPDWEKMKNGELMSFKNAFESARNSVSNETASGDLCDRVKELCEEAMSICDTLNQLSNSLNIENEEEPISEVVETTKYLQRKIRKLYAEASKSLSKNPLDAPSPQMLKMRSQSSSAVKSSTENTRYQTELAKEKLKDAKLRYERAFEALMKANEKQTQFVNKMAQLTVGDLKMETIRETLSQGIKALGLVREQWGQLILFFEMISNIIKCSLHSSLKDFVDHAEVRSSYTDKNPITNWFRDVLFIQATKANQYAFVVLTIAGAYVKISKNYLISRISCLGRLSGLDPKKDAAEMRTIREELHAGFKAAQQDIRDILDAERRALNEDVDQRIEQIRTLQNELPDIEPENEMEMQDAIAEGMKMTDEEIDRLV